MAMYRPPPINYKGKSNSTGNLAPTPAAAAPAPAATSTGAASKPAAAAAAGATEKAPASTSSSASASPKVAPAAAAAAAPAGQDDAPPQLPPWASQLKGNSALSKSFGTAGAAAKPPAPTAAEPAAPKPTGTVARPSWAAGKPGAAAAPAPAPALASPKAQAAIAQASPRAQGAPAPTKPSVVPPTSSSPKPQAGPMSPKPAPIVVVPSVSSAVSAAPAAPQPEPEPEPEPEGPPVYFAPDPADPSKTKLQPAAVLRTLLSQPLDPLRQWSNSDALRRRKDQWAPAILPADVALRIVNEVAALLLSEPNVLDLEAPVTVWPGRAEERGCGQRA